MEVYLNRSKYTGCGKTPAAIFKSECKSRRVCYYMIENKYTCADPDQGDVIFAVGDLYRIYKYND